MFIVYVLLGGLFSWLAIKSFGAAFSSNSPDEHALVADAEPDFSDEGEDDEQHWQDEPDYEDDEDELRHSSELEYSDDWCPEELKGGVE